MNTGTQGMRQGKGRRCHEEADHTLHVAWISEVQMWSRRDWIGEVDGEGEGEGREKGREKQGE